MKEAHSKGFPLFDSINKTFWNYYRKRKLISGCQGLGVWGGVTYKAAQGNFPGLMVEMFYWTVVVVAQRYALMKTPITTPKRQFYWM